MMADTNQIRIAPSGDVIATGVSYEDFLADYDGQHVEWVYGDVIQMSPVSEDHTALSVFLILLFEIYLSKTGGGRVLHDPMVMKPAPDFPGRAPDIQVILPENLDRIKKNEVAGPADLVVEIVSPGSHRSDRVTKFAEYERGGIREYWVLDPVRDETLFYQLNNDGIYVPVEPDKDGYYRSLVLDKLRLPVTVLKRGSIPRGPEIVAMVERMLEEK